MKVSAVHKISSLTHAALESLRDTNEKRIMQRFTETGIKILQADFGVAWFKPKGETAYGLAYKSPKMPYTPSTPRRKSGINSQIQNKRTPLLVHDVVRAGIVKKDAKQYMKSLAAIPVVYKNDMYGNIIICFKKTHVFSEEEKSLCSAIGNSAAQAITINRLNRNLHKAKSNLEQKVRERTAELLATNHQLKDEILERKKTQENLSQSQHFINQITNVVPGLITVINVRTNRYIYVNSASKSLLGYEREELLEKGVNFVNSLVHPDDVKRIDVQNREAMNRENRSKGDPVIENFEYRVRHSEGGWRWVHTYGIVFDRDSKGNIEHILNISVDITDRKEIENKLRESEARLEEAQSIAHIGSWEWAVTRNEVTWSDEMCRIYGVEPGYQGNYADFLSRVHSHDRAAVEEKVRKAYETGQSFEFYHRIITAEGKEKTLYARGNAVLGEDGSISKMIGTGQDVTDQKKAEEKLQAYTKELERSRSHLKQEKAKLDSVFFSMGEGVVATDAQGKVIAINPQALNIFGVSEQEAIGQHMLKLSRLLDAKGKVIPDDKRPIVQALKYGKRTTSSGMANTYYYPRKDGTTVPLGITTTAILHKSKIVGAIQVFRDVTKEAEIDKAKSELISLASHQLRTPLSAINWFSETLIKEEVGKLNKQQTRYMQEIFNANQKMVELVYDFLNVSRLELGTFTVKPIDLNIREVAEGVIRELKPAMQDKPLTFSAKYVGLPPLVHTDRKLMRIIIQNLLSNAVKYTPAKGRVRMEIIGRQKSKSKASIQISVADTGIGIPKSQQEHIFSKLFRADNIKKLDTEGTGLGLYILKSFVDFCGGKVRFVSKENKGTTFYVTLPVEIVQSTKRAAHSPELTIGAAR